MSKHIVHLLRSFVFVRRVSLKKVSALGAKNRVPQKVIETDDMKLAMKAGKLESAGKHYEALKVYA